MTGSAIIQKLHDSGEHESESIRGERILTSRLSGYDAQSTYARSSSPGDISNEYELEQ